MSKINPDDKIFKNMRTGTMHSPREMFELAKAKAKAEMGDSADPEKVNAAIATAKENLKSLKEKDLAGIDGDGEGKLGIKVRVEMLADGRTYLNADSLSFQVPTSVSSRLPEGISKMLIQKVIRSVNMILADHNEMKKIAFQPIEQLQKGMQSAIETAKEEALKEVSGEEEVPVQATN